MSRLSSLQLWMAYALLRLAVTLFVVHWIADRFNRLLLDLAVLFR